MRSSLQCNKFLQKGIEKHHPLPRQVVLKDFTLLLAILTAKKWIFICWNILQVGCDFEKKQETMQTLETTATSTGNFCNYSKFVKHFLSLITICIVIKLSQVVFSCNNENTTFVISF